MMHYQGSIKTYSVLKLVLLLLFLITIVIYFTIPLKGNVSMPLFYICFGLMILSNFIYFRGKKKENYLDFDTIFILVFCLVGFSTTFFYYNEPVFRAVFLGFPIEVEYINKGNFLSLLGLQSYLIGSLSTKNYIVENKKTVVINTFFLTVILLFLIILFVGTGGITHYRAEYNDNVASDGAGASKHILLLLVATSMTLIATEFYNKKIATSYSFNWLTITSLGALVTLLMWAGNRTAASQILLPAICLYALFLKKISFKKFILFAASGIVLMWFVQRMRTSDQSLDLSNPILLILDLTIPVRNTYVVMEYVDNYGYNYGKSMVLGISGTIPLMPSLIADAFPELKYGSAEILTDYTFYNHNTPEEFRIGLGTTIIADIYMSFGLLGVLILMYFLGSLVDRLTMRSLSVDYYSVVLLSAMLGNAIFIVRAGYFHPARFLVWVLVLALLNKILYNVWKR